MTVMTMMPTANNNPFQQHQHYHTTSTAITKGKKPYKSWLKDGVNGGPSSMEVLVSWLSYNPNYKKWKREDYSIDRVPKKELLEEIIDKLRQVGIYHRLAKDVASKISTLQSNYRMTRKWNETEAKKLRESGQHCRRAIYEELLKRFPYWEALHPVFGNRHSHTSYYSRSQYSTSDSIKNHQIVFKKKIAAQKQAQQIQAQPAPKQQHEEDGYSLTKFILKYQKRERILMEESTTMLNNLRQEYMNKISQEREIINQEKLQANLLFEKSLLHAGFTETEIKAFL